MNYEKLMKKCLNLAKKGSGCVSPNPLVGCIVLNSDNKIISKGYHHKFGENHAERDALLKLNPEDAAGGTLIVNLEPCSHFGKTPPCADLIIERKLKNVIIGMQDVNPIVAGNGIKKLQNAGINVISGVLEDECKKLNEVFIKNMKENKIFVAIKSASTIDGKIATSSGSSKWITSSAARNEVLNIRKMYDAIMTSSSTVLADNPSMLHKNKIVLDRNLVTDFYNANIYKQGNIFVYYDKSIDIKGLSNIKNIKFIPAPVCDNKIDLNFVFKNLYDNKIMSVLIESGGKLNGSALKFADKIYQFIAPKILGDNSARSSYDFRQIDTIDKSDNFKISDVKLFAPDLLVTLYPSS